MYKILQRTFFLFIFSPLFTLSQKYNFVQYSVKEGLAQSQVSAIVQDSSNVLWIGTMGGISSFDGKTFTNYSITEGLLSNFTTSIQVDKNQNIWAGSFQGLSVYDGKSFKNYNLSTKEQPALVTFIVKDINDGVWALYGGHLFQANKSSCKKIKTPFKNYITAIANDVKGNLFVYVFNEGLYKKNGNNWELQPGFTSLKSHLFVKEMVTGKNGIWILSDKGIMQYTNQGLKFFSVDDTVIKGTLCISEESKGGLWIGTNAGTYLMRGNETQHIRSIQGFTDHEVLCILTDSENNTWFGTSGSGLYRFTDDKVLFFDKDYIYPGAMGITKDKEGNVWFGTFGDGLRKYDGKKLTRYILSKHNKTANIISFCLWDFHQRLWVGTLGDGLWYFENGVFHHFSKKLQINETVFYGADIDENGKIVFAAPTGVYELNDQKLKKITAVTEFSNTVKFIGKDSLLVGTQQGLLFLHNNKKASLFNDSVLQKACIFSIAKDNQHVFIGTVDRGFFIGDLKKKNKVISISKHNGLSSNSIYGIAVDKRKRLWISTGSYLNQISFSHDFTKHSIRVFNKKIFSPEGNANTLFVDADDKIWSGTTDGLYIITPDDSIKRNTPLIALKNVSLFSLPVKEKKYYDSLQPFNHIPLNLSLPHNQNHITFEFQGVHLSDPDGLRYQYKLEGLEEHFSEPSLLNKVIYGSIPPGKYRFKARAISSEGIPSKNVIDYAFEIKTPFYQTIYFKVFSIFSLILVGFFAQLWYTRIKEKRRVQTEAIRLEEQQKIRKRTAEDFHDEMGNKLTRISILSEILKQKTADKNAVLQLVDQIKENSIALYNGTRDIIWSLSNESSNLYHLINRIAEFGIDLYHDTGIEFSAEGLNEDLKGKMLQADISRNLMMMMKEGMNNALRHAKAKKVTFSVNADGEWLEICLQDDGIGFDMKNRPAAHGVDNIFSRAQRMNAFVNVNSTSAGTKIKIKLKI